MIAKAWIIFLSTFTTPSTTIYAPGFKLFNPEVQSPKVICCPVESVATPDWIEVILADPANRGKVDFPHSPKSFAA